MKRAFARGAAALAAVCALLAAPGEARASSASPGATAAAVVRVGGVPCIGAGDLARLLDGVQYWRGDLRKLVIRTAAHRLTLTEDAPVALLDDRTLRFGAPVRSVGGELQVPLSLLPLLPADSASAHLVVDAGGERVRVAPAEGIVGAPRVALEGDATVVRFVTAHAAEARVTSRERTHFRVWLPGAPGGGAPDSLPAGAHLRSLRRLPAGEGVLWEFAVASGCAAWRLSAPAGADAAVLEFGPAGAGRERFVVAPGEGARVLRVVVLDPGHGGADAGVTVPGAVEKDLTLELARLLAVEIERRVGARVLLTRDGDRELDPAARAEIANRARADLVLSLHFDGVPQTRARGATAYCPPVADAPGGAAPGSIAMAPWRDVAARWAGASRSLADAVAAALAARGAGPARVRERLPVALLGVNAPGLSLECATLTSSDDLARVTSPTGLRALAAAITDGVLAWSRP